MRVLLLALAACTPTRVPEPLFPPIRRVDLPEVVQIDPDPEDCSSADIEAGKPSPVPLDAQGQAACHGQLVSPARAFELVQASKLHPLALQGLRACEEQADMRRIVYEERLRDERQGRALAEAEARRLRVVAPIAVVGGVLAGAALTVGVLAAADQALGATPAGAARAPR